MKDDVISRQAAIDILDAYQVMVENGEEKPYEWARLRMSELPSVQPERKTGQWICSDDMYETAVCSACKWDTAEPWGHIKLWFKFCPHCGAKMEGEDDGFR